MPTSNPRVSITFEPADLAVIDRFAEASHTARATVISQLVSSVVPMLEKAAVVMEEARAAPKHVQEHLAEGVRTATEVFLGTAASSMEIFGEHAREQQGLLPLGEAGKRRRGRMGLPAAPSGDARRGRKGPPPTNRGVKR